MRPALPKYIVGLAQLLTAQINACIPHHPHVCILARHDARISPATHLAFIHSILAQSYDHYQLYLINTVPNTYISKTLLEIRNSKFTVVDGRQCKGAHTYGYCETDKQLELLLEKSGSKSKCSQFLFTNSDNIYHREFLRVLMNEFSAACRSIVACHFVSHHPRKGGHLTTISTKMKRGHIDLGSAIVSADAIRNTSARFMRSASRIAADWFFFKAVYDGSRAGFVVVPNTLFFHQ